MEVNVPPLSLERLRPVIGPPAWHRLEAGLERARALLDGRALVNVNSTAAGGGVAEMLRSWVGLARGVGVSMRWRTISGTPEFFALTKRLHNVLHGAPGDGGPLGAAERALFDRVAHDNATDLIAALGPDDVAFLHDPQTAGMIPRLVEAGRTVIWRCHIGSDEVNARSDAGWAFLEPYVTAAHATVFTRKAYVPEFCAETVVAIVPPSIDAFSPKNQEMPDEQVESILRAAGLMGEDRRDGDLARFLRPGGEEGRVERRSKLISDGEPPGPGTTIVTQVSRWDRLKDPVGVLRGFAAAVPDEAHLILAGPGLGSVSDDPDGAAVLAEVEEAWRALPASIRARAHLACLPMEDLEENAAIVNALQRRSAVVVQKSLREGFGLTVTEAMWKARPVVASATGGIRDQIEDGVSGLLLADPTDLDAFGAAITALIDDPARSREIGGAARERVRTGFLEDRHTLQYVDLLGRLLGE
jgi:trehalose synthase